MIIDVYNILKDIQYLPMFFDSKTIYGCGHNVLKNKNDDEIRKLYDFCPCENKKLPVLSQEITILMLLMH